jgi:hypothetical protein
LSLQEEIEPRNGNPGDAREAEENLLKLNEEYLSSLRKADSSIFRRKYPKIF